MYKKYPIIFLFLIFALFAAVPSSASWLIYHKPEFKGRVIDAETKEPIEGAVVVAAYDKQVYGIVEAHSIIFKVRETVTDKNGEFRIPSYTTITHPLSWDGNVDFVIYKPGYGNFPWMAGSPVRSLSLPETEDFFSKGEVGSEGWVSWKMRDWDTGSRHKVTFGVVELPKAKTREERLRAMPSSPTGYRSKHLPLLYKALNEEGRRFGIGEVW